MPRSLKLPLLVTGFLGLLLTTGCATSRGSFESGWFSRDIRFEGSEAHQNARLRYRAGDLPSGWGRGDAPPGDFAFYNKDLGATIYADSSCGKKFDDSPLSVLSNHLTMGFTDVAEDSRIEGLLDGRGSLERVFIAKLDGVPVRLVTTVVKKDICVFDLVLISSTAGADRALEDYRSLRDGFEARFAR